MIAYTTFVDIVARALLGLGILAGVVCVMDWAIRTRKISPFSGVARFFRRSIDPLLSPVEARIVRFGGDPSAAPLWLFLGIVVSGIALLQLLRLFGGLLMQVSVAASEPRLVPGLLLGWAFQFVMFALVVRVISTWLPVSPYSRWIRWSYVSTEWLLAPLRRIIPSFGAFDVTPIAAYFLLVIVQRIIGL